MVVGASSCYASPLCTWFVAACMSVAHGGGDSRQVFALQSGKRSRRRRQLSKCSEDSGSGGSIQALVTSCLDFGPCSHYNKSYNNNNNNALSSLFGSNNVSLNRNQRRLNRAASSGITFCSNLGFFCFVFNFKLTTLFVFSYSFYVSLSKL